MSETSETITIKMSEYRELVSSDLTLTALVAAGVDNWEGYSYIDWEAVGSAIAAAQRAAAVEETTRV